MAKLQISYKLITIISVFKTIAGIVFPNVLKYFKIGFTSVNIINPAYKYEIEGLYLDLAWRFNMGLSMAFQYCGYAGNLVCWEIGLAGSLDAGSWDLGNVALCN